MDRCPFDLPVVPMPMSLRDIVVLATSAGMRVTAASFEPLSLTMQLWARPFSSRSVTDCPAQFLGWKWIRVPRIGWLALVIVPAEPWVSRLWGTCSIAGRSYSYRAKSSVERDDSLWDREKGTQTGAKAAVLYKKHFKKSKDKTRICLHHPHEGITSPKFKRIGKFANEDNRATSKGTQGEFSLPRRPNDGAWNSVSEETAAFVLTPSLIAPYLAPILYHIPPPIPPEPP